jgi:hypothetical protein
MTTPLLAVPLFRVFDTAGLPLAGGKVYTYAAGTTINKATYSDAAGATPNANPVILDSTGAATIRLGSGGYKIVVKDASDNTQWTVDNIYSSYLSGADVAALIYPQTAAESSASITPTYYNYQYGDLRRYGAVGDGSTDDSTAFQKAVTLGYVRIPSGYQFKIVTPATKTGKITILGDGKDSKLLCDGTVVTVTSGTGSVCDNFWMENITAPFLLVRSATSYRVGGTTSTETSNNDGYQPTVNDSDVYSGFTTGQKNQQIGPAIVFTANASDITVSRIYGRFVRIEIYDARRSIVRDCNIRGGKGTWGSIVFDNYTNIASGQTGQFNKAVNNHVRYSSYSGITFLNNYDGLAEGNTAEYCGESGIKTAQGTNARCFRMSIEDNHCYRNAYDGIDAASTYPLDDTQQTFHNIVGNWCGENGGTGINADGRFNTYVGNTFYKNYANGFWGLCSYSKIGENFLYDNNQGRNSSVHELLGGTAGNSITGNYIYSEAGQNSNAIYVDQSARHYIAKNYAQGSTFFFGNPGVRASVCLDNVDSNLPGYTDAAFVLALSNSAGTLQHAFYQEPGTASTGDYTARSGGNQSTTNTPTGTDSSTAFANGGKISTTTTNAFIVDTAAQLAVSGAFIATIIYNDTGTALIVRPKLASVNVNGTTRIRLQFEFYNAGTGAAVALNTTNIPAGKTIQVQFMGKLA